MELLPEIISSCVIAILTLVFVWAELSKRPELSLLDFCPIIRLSSGGIIFKGGFNNEPLFISKRLGIKELEQKDVEFNEYFSFSVDLANIGYEEIVVHEFVREIDEKRQMGSSLVVNTK